MKNIYLILSIIGAAIPYYFLGSFVIENGLDVLKLSSLLIANNAVSSFTADLLISIVVFWVFIWQQEVERPWLYVLLTLTVGLSFALPFFLYRREKSLEKRAS